MQNSGPSPRAIIATSVLGRHLSRTDRFVGCVMGLGFKAKDVGVVVSEHEMLQG